MKSSGDFEFHFKEIMESNMVMIPESQQEPADSLLRSGAFAYI